MMMKKCLWATLLFLTISVTADSAVIIADATGSDSGNTNFWGVSFGNGSGFIKSVEFDLSPLRVGMTFDFDSSTLPLLGAPEIDVLVGLQTSDINTNISEINPTSLIFEFSPESFSFGDSFRFTADTDYFSSPIYGHNIGGVFSATSPPQSFSPGLLFTVIMEGGATGSANFNHINFSFDNTSKSGITVTTASAIPVPATLWLFVSGLLTMVGHRKKTLSIQV